MVEAVIQQHHDKIEDPECKTVEQHESLHVLKKESKNYRVVEFVEPHRRQICRIWCAAMHPDGITVTIPNAIPCTVPGALPDTVTLRCFFASSSHNCYFRHG